MNDLQKPTQPDLTDSLPLLPSACGNCINFCKVSKTRGQCNFHTIWLRDKRKEQDVIKRMTVAKYNYCEHYEKKMSSKEVLLSVDIPQGERFSVYCINNDKRYFHS